VPKYRYYAKGPYGVTAVFRGSLQRFKLIEECWNEVVLTVRMLLIPEVDPALRRKEIQLECVSLSSIDPGKLALAVPELIFLDPKFFLLPVALRKAILVEEVFHAVVKEYLSTEEEHHALATRSLLALLILAKDYDPDVLKRTLKADMEEVYSKTRTILGGVRAL